jgi:CheY-like chemotaxis protein
MQNNFKAVILEDAVKDIRTATRILSQVGITNPTIFNDVPKAMMYLEDVVAGEKPCPNLMVVDLSFGVDSGFEALRFYKSNKKLSTECKVIVWTAMGERQQELCRLLGASHVVSKEDGENALLKAVVDVTGLPQQSASSI